MVSFPSNDTPAMETRTDDVNANGSSTSHAASLSLKHDIDTRRSDCELQSVITKSIFDGLDCKSQSNGDCDSHESSSNVNSDCDNVLTATAVRESDATCDQALVSNNSNTDRTVGTDDGSVVRADETDKTSPSDCSTDEISNAPVAQKQAASDETASVATSSSDAIVGKESSAAIDKSAMDSSNMSLFMEVTCESSEPHSNAQPASNNCQTVLPSSAVNNGQAKPSSLQKPRSEIRPMATVLFNIGLGIALQNVCQAKRQKLQRAKKSQRKAEVQATDSKLEKELEALTNKLSRFQYSGVQCSGCSFHCDSRNVLELHREYGHGQDELHFHCAFCHFSTFRESEYVFHVEAEHNRMGRVQPRKLPYECSFCSFENRSLGALTRHVAICRKNFNPKRNLDPTASDADIPIKKAKHEQQIVARVLSGVGHKVARNLPPVVSSVGTALPSVIDSLKPVVPSLKATNIVSTAKPIIVQLPQSATGIASRSVVLANSTTPPRMVQIGKQWYSLVPSAGDKSRYTAVPVSSTQLAPVLPPPPSLPKPTLPAKYSTQPSNSVPHQTSSDPMQSIINAAVAAAIAGNTQSKMQQAMSTPAPIIIAPTNLQVNRRDSTGSAVKKSEMYEVCELCDGTVADREALRSHFELAHKIKVDKMADQLVPVLGCSKCSKRFWTYQGLLRHLKDVHGSTDSDAIILPPQQSTQRQQASEKAITTFPTYTCSICGEKHIRYVLSHLKAKHAINVPDILNMKQCPCCGLNFISAEAVYTHIEDKHPEIVSDPALKMCRLSCQFCLAKFATALSLEKHCNAQHRLICSHCGKRLSGTDALSRHMESEHKHAKQRCSLCNRKFPYGSAYIRHVKTAHLRQCNITVPRIPSNDLIVANESKQSNGCDQSETQQDMGKLTNGKNFASDEVITIDID